MTPRSKADHADQPEGDPHPPARSSGMSLQHFPLTHLDLNYVVTFNDEGIAGLKDMKTLTKLYLRGTSITDTGIANLAGSRTSPSSTCRTWR
jgi:hypothetical protein